VKQWNYVLKPEVGVLNLWKEDEWKDMIVVVSANLAHSVKTPVEAKDPIH